MNAKVAAVVQRLRHIKENGLAGDTFWGFLHEGVALIATMTAFTLLGRSLGTAGYGDYASLYAIVGPLGNLAASGVPLALMQHVLRDREPLATTVGSCTSLTLLFGTGLAVIGILVGSLIIPTLPILTIALVIMLEFIVLPLSNIASTTIQTQAGYARATQLRTGQVLVRLTIILILHSMGNLTVASLAATHLVVSVIITGVMLQLTARHYGYRPWPRPFRKRHAGTSVSYSIGITGITLQNDGDKATLAAYGYREETGLYSAAYRIVQFGLLPVGVLTGATHQRFLHHEEGARDQHLRRAIKYAGVTLAYGVVFMAGVLLLAPVLPRLVGEDFRDSVNMVRWLAPLVLLRGLAMFPMNALMGLGKTFMRSLLLVATAALSMVLYITLIPIWNWKGAVAGTIIGESVLAAAAWFFLLRYQRLDNARIDASEADASESDASESDAEAAGDDATVAAVNETSMHAAMHAEDERS